MARITNRDCLEKVSNRFDLILLASERARQVAGGAPVTVSRDNDKPTVLALREIAQSTVTPEDLKDNLLVTIKKKQGFFEETEEDLENMLALDLGDEKPEVMLDESDLAELEDSNFEIREIGDEDDQDEDFDVSNLIGHEDE